MKRTRQSERRVKKEEEEDAVVPADTADQPKKKTKLEESGIKCSAHLNSLIDTARADGIRFDDLDIALTPDELAHTVSRALVSKHYGQSTQGGRKFCAGGALGAGKHILFGWMQPWNPYMPFRPGDPGLFFDGSPNLDADVPDGVRYTFVRLAACRWLYIGNYKMVNVAHLSVEEWRLQHDECKKNWMEKIHKKTWGHIIRRSIAARKQFRAEHGRAPTFDELQAAMHAVRRTRISRMGVPEIARAYDDGDELLVISALRFVGYDAAFQRELIAKSRAAPEALDEDEDEDEKKHELEEDTIAARVHARKRRRTVR